MYRHCDHAYIHGIERRDYKRVKLRRGQALHLGGGERTDLVAREQPKRRRGEAAKLHRGQRIRLRGRERLDFGRSERADLHGA